MPRKPDALDAAKISSNGSSVEMHDVISIPKRGGRPKKSVAEPVKEESSVTIASPEPVAKQVVISEPIPVKKYDSYRVVADAKAWMNGQLIHFAAGKIVNQITFGPNFLERLRDQNVQLEKIEE